MIERRIIKSSFVWEEIGVLLLTDAKPEYFTLNEQKRIFIVASEFLNKFNRVPTFNEIRILLEKKKEEKVLEELSIIEETSIDDIDFVFLKQEVQQWLSSKQTTFVLVKIVEDIEKGKVDIGDIKAKIERINEYVDDDVLFYTHGDITERYNAMLELSQKHFDFRIEALDKLISMRRKELLIFGAETGVGKSVMLSNLAVSGALQGMNVLYITLELSPYLISKRLDAIMYQVPINEIGISITDKELKGFRENLMKIYPKLGHILVKEFPPNTLSASMLRQYLNSLKRVHGINIDVLIVDYIGLMRSNSMRVMTEGNLYQIFRNVTVELLQLTKERNLILLSAAQLKSSSERRRGYNSSDIAGSIEIPRNADYVVMLNILEEEQFPEVDFLDFSKYSYFSVKVTKNRNGIENVHFYIRRNRQTLIFEDIDDFEKVQLEKYFSGRKGQSSRRGRSGGSNILSGIVSAYNGVVEE